MKELHLGADLYKFPKKKVIVWWEIYRAIQEEKEMQERMNNMKAKTISRRGKRH